EKKDAKAQSYLGSLYEAGLGVATNQDKAFEWYLKAAGQNEPEAEFRVAKFYHEGRAVKQNSSEALYWYKQAAAHGHKQASEIVQKAAQSLEPLASVPDTGHPQPPKALVSTKDGVQVLDFSTKITERGSLYDRWAWKLTLKNNTPEPKQLRAKITFLDQEGFNLE